MAAPIRNRDLELQLAQHVRKHREKPVALLPTMVLTVPGRSESILQTAGDARVGIIQIAQSRLRRLEVALGLREIPSEACDLLVQNFPCSEVRGVPGTPVFLAEAGPIGVGLLEIALETLHLALERLNVRLAGAIRV